MEKQLTGKSREEQKAFLEGFKLGVRLCMKAIDTNADKFERVVMEFWEAEHDSEG